ncbi:MAG: acyl-CoA/acyl-ACP dehydrogenase [Chloroflexi bacterium]|nr:acyl-CoA/acyl-ACP dehydrogenase [Chloroflexota bacterium]
MKNENTAPVEAQQANQTVQEMLEAGQALVRQSAAHFADRCMQAGNVVTDLLDTYQSPLYELAHLATQLMAAVQLQHHSLTLVDDERPGSRLVHQLAMLYAAETLHNLQFLFTRREASFGLEAEVIASLFGGDAISRFLTTWMAYSQVEEAANLIEQVGNVGENNLTTEHLALQIAFRQYAADKVAPLAEEIHRQDLLIPEKMIADLAEMGCFGLSIPERYGGFAENDQPDHLAMVLVADELSRASLGTAGSLGTRPELLAKALLKGGTVAQKQQWLPLIARGEKQAAVAVTEPDYGSNVAGITTTARLVPSGWRLNGTKMWSTFAGRADILMVLARTNPDRSQGHRGLSLFIVEKPPYTGHEFAYETDGGRLVGRAIAAIGYRGMHSFELSFEDFFVPAENLIGGDSGLGRGFYLQMHGFTASRLQTAGRALGVMAAAFNAALHYSRERVVFDRRLMTYPLTRRKLVRMAMHTQAARRLTFHAARAVDAGGGSMAAAMAKLLTARTVEWITREAQQLHGGMGYAEEFPISRHFLDARVLSIFEGTEEVLALRIIARTLLEET